MRDVIFAVYKTNFITLKYLCYKDITIPKGFIFDGVTVKPPFTIIFSNEDLKRGIRASCFHDWMCQHKELYSRRYATDVLVSIWRKDGLSPFKSLIVKYFVNIFQFFRGGWK